jgi:hypothetical protein
MRQPPAGCFRAVEREQLVEQVRDGEALILASQIWQSCGDEAEVQQRFRNALDDDEALLRLLVDLMQVGTSQTQGDRVALRIVSVNPRIFESYLLSPVDLDGLEICVGEIEAGTQLGEIESEAVQAFEGGMVLIRNGRSPEDPFTRTGL